MWLDLAVFLSLISLMSVPQWKTQEYVELPGFNLVARNHT